MNGRYHESVKRWAIAAGAVLFIAVLAVAYYEGYRNLKALKSDIVDLRAQINDVSRTTQEQAAAAMAARQFADQAATNALLAAGARKQAEEQRQHAEEQKLQAEAGRAEAMTSAQRSAEQAKQAQAQMAAMRREREEELNHMQEALSKIVETHRTNTGVTIVLRDSTFRFPFDSAELSPKNREILSRIAGILLVSKGYGVSIFGYTDDVGTPEYNQQLSIRRAKAVESYLAQSGLDPGIMNVKGYGKTSPLVEGSTADARSRNRRVEIALTESSIRYMLEPSTSAPR